MNDLIFKNSATDTKEKPSQKNKLMSQKLRPFSQSWKLPNANFRFYKQQEIT